MDDWDEAKALLICKYCGDEDAKDNGFMQNECGTKCLLGCQI